MSGLVLSAGFPYGAPELERAYRKYFTSALLLGIALAYSLVGCYWGGVYFLKDEASPPPRRILIFDPLKIGPPPSIAGAKALPPISIATADTKPSTGIPVPVPDAEVNSEQAFVTPQEINVASGTSDEATGFGGGEVIVETPIQIIDDSPPPKVVLFQKAPVIIKHVQPLYPEIARKAGIEGTVWVELWITKEGKVKKAVVAKSTSEIFNQPTLDAAVQFVFTPAMMQNGLVAVWVTVPFHYRLK
jgi:protein TonB